MNRVMVLTVALLMATVPAYATDAPPQIKPTDSFAVTLNAQQWQAVMASVTRSDVVSARDAGDLANAIRQQIMAKAQPAKPAK